MEEKLDQLALAKRRIPSTYIQEEVSREDWINDLVTPYAIEDKVSGHFPYNENTVQCITDFYEGKDIFITGGTGFVGKVLIEKLLRSLPKGGRIFLLIRGRKGVQPQERIEAMLKLPLFKLLMTENPKAAERLMAIEGDCASLGLGLSHTDRQTLIDNVSIVFHCAATVRFHLPFSFVILVNTRGTREIVYLCKDMKRLEAFVHVSTAYTNATTGRASPIPEEVLPAGLEWRTAIAAAENSLKSSNNDGFDFVFKKLQPLQANTYTYSKLLSENLVEEECKDLPAVIVRPSVLLGTYEDPFGGWNDNLLGPNSVWDGIGRGIVRTILAGDDIALDYLPVDINIKTLICAGWHRGVGFRMRSNPEKIDVVNNCTSRTLKARVGFLNDNKQLLFDNATSKYIVRYPRCLITQNFWLFWLITLTSELPLGIAVDTALKLCRKKPILLEVYRRIYFTQTHFLYHFLNNEFRFDDKWQGVLDARIPTKEKDRFSMMSKYYHMAFSVDNIAGIIKHVFHETPVTRKDSNRQIMHIVDWIQNAVLVGLGLWIVSWLIF